VTARRVAILVTGEEILQGRVQERNAGYVAGWLADRGIPPARITVVGDGLDDVCDALRALLDAGADLVVLSGGLGPTHDDRTMEAVAAAVGLPLELSGDALEMVVAGRAGIRAVERIDGDVRRQVEEKQALLPRGSIVIPPAGTAPGAVVSHGDAAIVVLPGPPWEFQQMWARVVRDVPAVARRVAAASSVARRLLRLHGVVESEVAQEVARLSPAVMDAVEIGICARTAEIEVASRGDASAVQAVDDALTAAFGNRLYSRDGSTAIEMVAAALVARGETLAVAESCTGGLLGAALTNLPGSSRWYHGGVIAYDNSVKQGLLGVDPDTVQRHGAVSDQCAREMAVGVRASLGTHWALSITGVAGPEGGTAEKPVGLVYLGIAAEGLVHAHERRFRGDRERIRERAAATAIHLLRRELFTK
jgi:nicotinamide-nucleotide amidase